MTTCMSWCGLATVVPLARVLTSWVLRRPSDSHPMQLRVSELSKVHTHLFFGCVLLFLFLSCCCMRGGAHCVWSRTRVHNSLDGQRFDRTLAKEGCSHTHFVNLPRRVQGAGIRPWIGVWGHGSAFTHACVLGLSQNLSVRRQRARDRRCCEHRAGQLPRRCNCVYQRLVSVSSVHTVCVSGEWGCVTGLSVVRCSAAPCQSCVGS